MAIKQVKDDGQMSRKLKKDTEVLGPIRKKKKVAITCGKRIVMTVDFEDGLYCSVNDDTGLSDGEKAKAHRDLVRLEGIYHKHSSKQEVTDNHCDGAGVADEVARVWGIR